MGGGRKVKSVMLATIIVPIFNIENYIKQCIDSLLPLSKHNCEIIMVAGNSSDCTNDIALQYAAQYADVQFIYQNGKGLSNARNCGLRVAKAEFTIFVDGDDFVDAAVLSRLLDSITSNTDVLMTNFYRNYENNGSEILISEINNNASNGLENLQYIINPHKCFWNVWRNIYRTDFLQKHDLLFLENTYAEDIDYFSRVCIEKPVMQYSKEAFYHYRMDRKGSLMNDVPLVRLEQTVHVIEESVQRLRNCKEPWTEAVISGFQFEYLLNMVFVCNYSKQQRKQAIKSFTTFHQVLCPACDCLVRWLTRIVSILGIRGVSRVLSMIRCLKRKIEHRKAT